ncbi:MAG: GTPase Era [Gammaproteobacteria bacterium]|nr:GTPase Era [Gammaproteobacteria bacterium]|tara:strand:- start:2460 stop:3353 length:894 start_codon:yes stop_codon:yes gene_type:complete
MNTRFGFVAIVGRPNVGKSTLLNHVLGFKLSITSRKPQTTRHRILGIWTEDETQIAFVDTPGMHLAQPKAMNRVMNQTAEKALVGVDAVVMLTEGRIWNKLDERVYQKIRRSTCPSYWVINKVDKLDNKNELLPHIQTIIADHVFDEVFPISALKNLNLGPLLDGLREQMPAGSFMYAEDQITDRSERFLSAEIVREQIMRQLGDEVPYETTVEIESFERNDDLVGIHALISVERDGQKAILVGGGGSRLKQIGIEARRRLEELLFARVALKLWVKVRASWSNDEHALKSLGYFESD